MASRGKEGLRCQACHHEFKLGSTLEVIAEHFRSLHPERVKDDGEPDIHLETSWDKNTGEFTPVAPNRTQRRRQKRR